ncbi:MAG: hypothetical protein ABIP27_09905 [Flavobacterium circumlabens]|uniref:DUF4468 domain-containing protein n=1 Tax=Flavobacterium circumlabens TaxID=2133765 RepID=A0A4Y7UID8_9FLAO|nr:MULTISPECIES: hypothetical protein [Flavobacterium]QSB27246.1 hypothetical protein HAV12_000465 [Flavobacterium sp. CLA17]TCN61107.1 hypothetical protein EV142_101694 [Flavobacterium circumlabens]TEB46213.1 hypothetical protein D0809_04255 [Flavobacterium circumlabens]
MKKLIIACFFISGVVFAQDMKVVQGNFDFLKDQKEINTEFDYSNFTMMKEKKSEAQYVEEHKADLDEKAKGNGNLWQKRWIVAKQQIWTPKFLEIGNIVLSKAGKDVNFQEGLKTPYTLIVQTVWLYPGWDAGIMKQPAKVTTNLKFVETANKSNVLLEITSEEAPGDQWGSNFNNETRIGEGYAKTAKSLSKLLLKKAFK